MAELDAKVRFLRYLHYGKGEPLYKPGDRMLNMFYKDDTQTSLEDLIAGGREDELFKAIKDTLDAKTCIHPACIVYALAKCSKLGTDLTKKRVYNVLWDACEDANNFLIFVNFCCGISTPKTGMGRGKKRALRNWYKMSADSHPQSLVRKLTCVRSRCTWSHKDVLKLIHMKLDGPVQTVTINYIMTGLKAAEAMASTSYPEDEGVKEVLRYARAIEQLKNETNREEAARLIHENNIELDNVPDKLHRSHEVWRALLPNLSFKTILEKFHLINRYGLLKPSSPVVEDFVKKLEGEDTLEAVHPAAVFIVRKVYEFPLRVQKIYLERRDPRVSKKLAKTPPSPNNTVLSALSTLFKNSLKNLTPTGKRWLICVDVRQAMGNGKCWSTGVLHPSEAAALLILSVLKSEPADSVTVCAFGVDSLIKLNTSDDTDHADLLKMMSEVKSGAVVLATPIEYAMKNKLDYDVFMVITDTYVRKHGLLPAGEFPLPTDPVPHRDALAQYRFERNLPTTRMVIVALSLRSIKAADPSDPYSLDCVGFDATTPVAIHRFVSGAF